MRRRKGLTAVVEVYIFFPCFRRLIFHLQYLITLGAKANPSKELFLRFTIKSWRCYQLIYFFIFINSLWFTGLFNISKYQCSLLLACKETRANRQSYIRDKILSFSFSSSFFPNIFCLIRANHIRRIMPSRTAKAFLEINRRKKMSTKNLFPMNGVRFERR